MKIFLSVSSFDRGYGGPAYTVARLGEELGRLGHEIGLWAPDTSAPDLVETDNCRRLAGELKTALACFGPPDVVHDNGLWRPNNHAVARSARQNGWPLMVSPRGMLEPWALAQGRWKKRLAWSLYQGRDLRGAVCLHATAASEAESILARLPGARIRTIANGVDIPRLQHREAGEKRERTVLFLSRLHPKKGLPMLLNAWQAVKPAGWRLRIVGHDEAGYAAEVRRVTEDLGLSDTVTVESELHGRAKTDAYFGADLFVLPSYSENFGIVVAEALAHGVPVITTEGTPWQALPETGCGWWIRAETGALQQVLKEATDLPPDKLQAMGNRGREYVQAEYAWGHVGQAFEKAYGMMS